jgi:putative effector of murein hydrolase LrgA (UPF0299 family)
MMMNPLDYIVLISLLPVIPLIATRESWLPKKVPPFIFGVYLLYCAFAAWYFKVGWFTTIATALVGLLGCGVAIFEYLAHLKQENSQR